MRILVLCLLSLFVLSSSVCAAPGYRVYVNGKPASVNTITKNDRMYIPVDTVAGRLRLPFEWEPVSNFLRVGGTDMPGQALFSEGSLYVPVRNFEAATGFKANIDSVNRIVYITGSSSAAASAGTYGTPSAAVKNVPNIQPLGSVPQTQRSASGTQTIPSSPYNPSAVQSGASLGKGAIPDAYNSYPQTAGGSTTSGTVRPVDGMGTLTDGLRLPPGGPQIGGIPTPSVPADMSYIPSHPSASVFTPVTERNAAFSVTVTNVEEVEQLKDYYKPNAGSKYVVVYISQQNVSPQVQIYSGKFSLADESSHLYDYMQGLSNYWLTILKPGGVNYGYLVFEVPQHARPSSLILHAVNTPPLTVKLNY